MSNLSYYVTKSGVEKSVAYSSKFAKIADLANLKTNVGKLDIDEF